MALQQIYTGTKDTWIKYLQTCKEEIGSQIEKYKTIFTDTNPTPIHSISSLQKASDCEFELKLCFFVSRFLSSCSYMNLFKLSWSSRHYEFIQELSDDFLKRKLYVYIKHFGFAESLFKEIQDWTQFGLGNPPVANLHPW